MRTAYQDCLVSFAEPSRAIASCQIINAAYIYRYPLETISILPGSQFYGKLSPDQVTEMLKFTTMKPHVTMAYLKDGMPHLNLGGKSDLLRAWSLDAETRPMTPKARLLDPPQVVYAG